MDTLRRIVSIAWRNAWRTPRRTVTTVAAMTLAVLVMILYSSLIEGYLRDLERDAVEVELGDLQIHQPGYRDAPSIYEVIDNADELVARLADDGFEATARLRAGGLVASGEASSGALLVGLDPRRDAEVSAVWERVAAGAWLDDNDQHGVVLGKRLARGLGIAPGDELIVLSQATDGSMANDLYTVRGVLSSVSEQTDSAVVFLTEPAFRELFALGRGAHQLLVRRPSALPLADAREQVAAIAAPLEVKTWRELQPLLASMLDAARGVMLMVFLIVYVAIAILILNATLMAVFERVRELGVLKALGMSPRRIVALVLVETGLQTALAITLGVALAAPGLWYLVRRGIDVGALGDLSVAGMSFVETWRGAISAATFAGPIAVISILVVLAVLYPALKAARISPAEAMRHQ